MVHEVRHYVTEGGKCFDKKSDAVKAQAEERLNTFCIKVQGELRVVGDAKRVAPGDLYAFLVARAEELGPLLVDLVASEEQEAEFKPIPHLG